MDDDSLISRVQLLAAALRRSGVDVSTGELIDGFQALSQIDVADRTLVRCVLRSTLTKAVDDSAMFDRLFDRLFRPVAIDSTDKPSGAADSPTALLADGQGRPSGVSQRVLDALRSGDTDTLRLLAQEAVDSFAGFGGDAPDDATQRYFVHRVMRAIDISRMLSAALQARRREGDLSEFELSVTRSEYTTMLEEFRRRIADEIADRLDALAGGAADIAGAVDPADRAIVDLSPSELADLRRAVAPLARRLVARIGRQRRLRSTGRLDVRRTVRRSLQSGGVPIDVSHRRRRPQRPDVVLLCDVSGSVAEFARFTFALVNALHAEMRHVRSFAFVDGVAEVTDLFRTASHEIHVARFVERRGVVRLDGHSDYGRVFSDFNERFAAAAVSRRTTVIVMGDARGNYRDGQVSEFARFAAQAKRVYWLNPEPTAAWGHDDSLIDEYRSACAAVFEVRTLRQIADAIATIV